MKPKGMDGGHGPAPPATAWLGLAAAVVALVTRFVLVGDTSYTYNEATYVELAAHPWWSSFYPDQVFVRHPPLGLLLLAGWRALFGAEEWVMRLPALLLSVGGVVVLWDAARRGMGGHAPGAVAAVLGLSFLLHTYALEATMYPLAFLMGSWVVWCHAARRPKGEGWALTGLALTHLFGFLFLALWAWRRRDRLGRVLATAWPALLWFAAATAAALAVNTEGDIIRLGPLGQGLRAGGGDAGASWLQALVIHLASGALAVWLLNPVLVGGIWRVRSLFPSWTAASVVLVAFSFIGPPYPRYALVWLPFIVYAGIGAITMGGRESVTMRGRRRYRTVAVAAGVVAILSMPTGFAYLLHGPDPRAAGDVPGVQDWAAAVDLLPDGPLRIATSGPTSTAYYHVTAGWEVTDRSDAPYALPLEGPSDRTVLRVDAPWEVQDVGADAWILPDHWDGVKADVEAAGGVSCGAPNGLLVYATRC